MAEVDGEVAFGGVRFAVGAFEDGVDAVAGHAERGRGVGVYAFADRRGVIGGDQDSPFVEGAEFVEDGADDVLVDLLEGFDFCGGVAEVARFVGGLDVDNDEIVVVEGGDGGGTFARVVRVQKAGCSFDVEHGHADSFGEAANEIDGGDDRAADAISFVKWFERFGATLPPEPDVRSGVLAEVAADKVNVVAGEDFAGLLHDADDPVGAGAVGHIVGDVAIGDIMRRGALELSVGSVVGDHEVAVGDAGVEAEASPAEFFVEVGDEQVGFALGDVAGGEVLHDFVDDGDEVATEDELVGADVDIAGGCFERGAAGVVHFWVVAEEREGGDVAAGGEAGRDGVDEALAAV